MRVLATCRDVVDLITEYLEGGLPADDRLAFERHVVFCPPCRGYLTQMRAAVRAAGAIPAEEPLSAEARDGLLAAFHELKGAS